MKAGVCLGRRSGQTPMRIPRHIGVLRMPSGASYYGPSYISPDQITGKEEGTSFGFTSELWLVRHNASASVLVSSGFAPCRSLGRLSVC